MILDTGLAERTARLWRRQRAARRLGTRFNRAASFTLPRAIRIGGRDVALAVPDEQGQRVAFVELLLDDCYGLRQLARRAKVETVIDIGANVGLFGLAARAAFPNARIHAYEPDPALAAALSRHAKSADVTYFPEAVGHEQGFISLDIQPGESVHSRSRADPAGSIPQLSLRQVLERIGGGADLIKMDCEGAEWAILKDRESWRRVNFLTMEYHLFEDRAHEAIAEALQGIGFSVRWHRPASNFGLVFAERIAR